MDLLTADTLKTACIALHLLGLSLGVGGALTLDLYAFRYFYLTRITLEKLLVFQFIARIVTLGLAILWATGIAFLVLYYRHQPELLANQKIWAKLVIVTVLTINGFYLHQKVFPIMRRNLGHSLFYRVSVDEKATMFTLSAISLVSWIFPLVLGIAESLNFTAGVENILAFYFLMLSVACVTMCILYGLFMKPLAKVLYRQKT